MATDTKDIVNDHGLVAIKNAFREAIVNVRRRLVFESIL